MTRSEFIKSLIGLPYEKNAKGPNSFDCWHLATYVQYHLFGRRAPDVNVPDGAGWAWMISQFTTHPELGNWVEVLQPANGIVQADDGAMVLMARNKQPAHCGVWLQREQRILHADEQCKAVLLQGVNVIRSCDWSRLRFYEPR